MVLRTFYKSIPVELIEAARVDGASEFKTFFRIVLPLSKPGIATIGMFTMIAYWNDWFLGMLYIVDQEKYPVQTLLWSMQKQSGIYETVFGKMRWNMQRWQQMRRQTAAVWLLLYWWFFRFFWRIRTSRNIS